ncbi:hypothetical protein GIB67_025693 [Kingdonia uniflora]|uniref:F-box protein n=1 Tax=Kingdonia uniflora TaxID=39325 RepID=A0A7J7P347_9MAGN|nr:hypothetical protein GIB67_025693 [Kingdonia uniflora]
MSATLPWEVVVLFSQHLDPKILAVASCVCKSWLISMSSNHLWKPFCFYHFPSLSALHLTYPTISYKHLYSLGYVSSSRRLQNPVKPRISLDDLVFIVDVFDGDSHVFSMLKNGEHLSHVNGCDGMFRFDVDVDVDVNAYGEKGLVFEMSKCVRVRWTVVLKHWRGVFVMMDCKGKKGKGSLDAGGAQWFSEDLHSTGCCEHSNDGIGRNGLMAELGLGFSEGVGDSDGKLVEKVSRVEKVTMGVLNVFSCRYVNVDEGLRYLQSFLPHNALSNVSYCKLKTQIVPKVMHLNVN